MTAQRLSLAGPDLTWQGWLCWPSPAPDICRPSPAVAVTLLSTPEPAGGRWGWISALRGFTENLPWREFCLSGGQDQCLAHTTQHQAAISALRKGRRTRSLRTAWLHSEFHACLPRMHEALFQAPPQERSKQKSLLPWDPVTEEAGHSEHTVFPSLVHFEMGPQHNLTGCHCPPQSAGCQACATRSGCKIFCKKHLQTTFGVPGSTEDRKTLITPGPGTSQAD